MPAIWKASHGNRRRDLRPGGKKYRGERRRIPGEPELAHQKNESMDIENLIKCAKIFADAIFELAGGQLRERRNHGEESQTL